MQRQKIDYAKHYKARFAMETYFRKVSTKPLTYEVVLKIDASIEFCQTVIWGKVDVDFDKMINAIQNDQTYKCGYSLYGTTTTFHITPEMFIIERKNDSGKATYKLNIQQNRQTFIKFAEILRNCVMECNESIQNIPQHAKDFLKTGHELRTAMNNFTHCFSNVMANRTNDA